MPDRRFTPIEPITATPAPAPIAGTRHSRRRRSHSSLRRRMRRQWPIFVLIGLLFLLGLGMLLLLMDAIDLQSGIR